MFAAISIATAQSIPVCCRPQQVHADLSGFLCFSAALKWPVLSRHCQVLPAEIVLVVLPPLPACWDLPRSVSPPPHPHFISALRNPACGICWTGAPGCPAGRLHSHHPGQDVSASGHGAPAPPMTTLQAWGHTQRPGDNIPPSLQQWL